MPVQPRPIEDEDSYRIAVGELTKRARPPWVLRVLMNALESYRQARKMGWSRPQNKDGVTTFHAFELDLQGDRALIELAGSVAAERPEALDPEHRRFVAELLTDPTLRGFVFVHDIVDGARRFEGATVSLGRVVKGSPRHRDRVDVIVEREVVDGAAGPAGRVRVYVDPFGGTPVVLDAVALGLVAEELFAALAAFYDRFRDVPEKAWRHWTQDYIDYFGPRASPVRGTAFPTPIDELGEPPRRGQRRTAPPAVASL